MQLLLRNNIYLEVEKCPLMEKICACLMAWMTRSLGLFSKPSEGFLGLLSFIRENFH